MPSVQPFFGYLATRMPHSKPLPFKGRTSTEYQRQNADMLKELEQYPQTKFLHAKQKAAYEAFCDHYHPLNEQIQAATSKQGLLRQMNTLIAKTLATLRKSPDDASFK